MLLRNEAKVGLIVFAAIVVLVGVYWFLGGLGMRTSSYPVYAEFADARKLDKGADVRMAGVKIGIVRGITLTKKSRARIELWILNENPIPADSVARITAGGFIGDNYIEILPGSSSEHLKARGTIRSGELVQFDQLMGNASEVLTELKKSVVNINEIIGDKEVINAAKETVAELHDAAGAASDLIASAKRMIGESSPNIRMALGHLESAMANADQVSQQIEDLIAKDARPSIKKALGEATAAITDLGAAVGDAREFIGSMKGAAKTVNDALGKVSSVATQANEMMTKLNDASTGIRALATDEELQKNLRQTMRNTLEASEQAKQLITNLNCRFGQGGSGPTPMQKSAIPEYGISTNSLWNTSRGNYRFDANYTFAGGDNSFYRVGGYNIGEHARLTLQGGKTLDQRNAFRYGLYASRLGIGYDYHIDNRFIFSADVFRPNDPQMELRGVIGITDNFGLYGGMRDFFDPNGRDFLVGIRYQK